MGGRGPRSPYPVRPMVTAFLAMLGIFAACRKRLIASRRVLAYLSLLLLAVAAVNLTSCTSTTPAGASEPSPNATPKGPTHIIVTATSGAEAQPITINLNVN
jgi:hypothetical protein